MGVSKAFCNFTISSNYFQYDGCLVALHRNMKDSFIDDIMYRLEIPNLPIFQILFGDGYLKSWM